MRLVIFAILTVAMTISFKSASASDTFYTNVNNKVDVVALGEGIDLNSSKKVPCFTAISAHSADSQIKYNISVDDHSHSARSVENATTSTSIGGSYSFGAGDVSGSMDLVNTSASEIQVDDQRVTVAVDLTADVGKEYVTSISLNDLGKIYAEQGARSFNSHCGVLTAFGLFRGIRVTLLFTLTANSSNEKNTLVNALKASLGGSYYGASANASFTQQLDQTFEEHRKAVSVSLNGFVRAADGIKAVPDMANALKNAGDHPFEAAVTSAAGVIGNLKGDLGSVTSVQFENSDSAVPAFALISWAERLAFWKKTRVILKALEDMSEMAKGSMLILPDSDLLKSTDNRLTLARLGWKSVCSADARWKYFTTEVSSLNLAFYRTCGYPTETHVDLAESRVNEVTERCLSADNLHKGYCSDEALLFAIETVAGSQEVNIFAPEQGVTIQSSTQGKSTIIQQDEPSAIRGAGVLYDTPESDVWLAEFYQNIDMYRQQAKWPAGLMINRFITDVDDLWAKFAPSVKLSFVDIYGKPVDDISKAVTTDSPVFLTSTSPYIYLGYDVVSNGHFNLHIRTKSSYIDGFADRYANIISWPKTFVSQSGNSPPTAACSILIDCIRDMVFTTENKDATSAETFIEFETLNGKEKRSIGSLLR